MSGTKTPNTAATFYNTPSTAAGPLENYQPIYLQHDQFMDLQDTVWQELADGIAAGLCTEGEALEAFMDWHDLHIDLGSMAMYSVQVAGEPCAIHADGKRQISGQ